MNSLFLKITIFVFLFSFSCASYPKDALPVNWELIGPGDADQITSLNFLENGDIFAGTDIGGIYRSEDIGNSWQPLNIGLNNLDITTRIIQSPADNTVLFVGTRGGLYKSNNYG